MKHLVKTSLLAAAFFCLSGVVSSSFAADGAKAGSAEKDGLKGVWSKASKEDIAAAENSAMLDAKNQLAIYYYYVAYSEGQDIFADNSALEQGFEEAFKKCEVLSPKRYSEDGDLNIKLHYKFTVTKFEKDDDLKARGALPGNAAESIAAANVSKMHGMAGVAVILASIKVSETETLAEFVSKGDPKLRGELAIMLFNLTRHIPSTWLSCSRSGGGSRITDPQTQKPSWMINYNYDRDTLMVDLAKVLAPFKGPNAADLKRLNKGLPEMVRVTTKLFTAPADYATSNKGPANYAPKTVYGPAFAALQDAFEKKVDSAAK